MQNTSIIHKITGITLCLTITPLLIIGVLYYVNVRAIVENEVIRSYEDMADQYVSGVDFRVNVYTSLLTDITLSEGIQEALVTMGNDFYDYVEKEKKIAQVVNSFSIRGNYREIERINIYTYEDTNMLQGKYLQSMASIKDESWVRKVDLQQRRLQWASSNDNDKILSFVKPISSLRPEKRLDIVGLAKLDIDRHNTFKISNKRIDRSETVYLFILDEFGQVIYKNNETKISTEQLLRNFGHYYKGAYRNFGDIEGIVIHRDIGFRDWKAIFVCPLQTIKEKILRVTIFIVLAIVSLAMLSLFFLYLFSKSFSQRFKAMLKKMDQVKKGKLDIDFVIEGNDEIAIADRNFNEMVIKLNETINENYLQKIAKREAELRALQFQINPHFIYNTLECIKSMAIIHNCRDISNITQKLGNMMRYNINIGQNEFVTLSEEISQIQNYIEIQKIRMGDKLEVFFDIPDDLLQCRVLKFILQPIVENLVQHGFHNKRERGCAEITAYSVDNDLYIKVQDDGMGIPEDRLNKINQALSSDEESISDGKRKSIGLQNVNSRIRILYGKEYGISISSIEGSGTIVTVKIPMTA